MKSLLALNLLMMILLAGCGFSNKNKAIQILILSGSNNHEWQETTPFLQNMFAESGVFTVEITNRPDTLSFKTLKQFDAIVSNWNSWPDNDRRWNSALEEGIIQYLEEGGGFLFFHASTSAFYNWPEFREITTASWEENTNHGKKDTVEVYITDSNHPITQGLENFQLFDELWINARKNPGFTVLGSATDKKQKEQGTPHQPAIFTLNVGEGRVFHTILGHDTVAMGTPGFKKLMLRATEWVATEEVKN